MAIDSDFDFTMIIHCISKHAINKAKLTCGSYESQFKWRSGAKRDKIIKTIARCTHGDTIINTVDSLVLTWVPSYISKLMFMSKSCYLVSQIRIIFCQIGDGPLEKWFELQSNLQKSSYKPFAWWMHIIKKIVWNN